MSPFLPCAGAASLCARLVRRPLRRPLVECRFSKGCHEGSPREHLTRTEGTVFAIRGYIRCMPCSGMHAPQL